MIDPLGEIERGSVVTGGVQLAVVGTNDDRLAVPRTTQRGAATPYRRESFGMATQKPEKPSEGSISPLGPGLTNFGPVAKVFALRNRLNDPTPESGATLTRSNRSIFSIRV